MNRSTRLSMLLMLFTFGASAQEPVEFSDLDWHIRGDWKQGEHLGRPALLLRNAILDLDEVVFGNGTIEFDVAVAGHRSFMGVAFRVQGDGSYEDFYIRPHQSGRFDAMQYTPVWHTASAWQLYPEHNASGRIPRNEWLPVRIVVEGHSLRAWVGEGDEPSLAVDRMRGPDAPGGLALRSFFPGARNAPDFHPNAFSNFRFTPGAPHQARPEESIPTEAGVIEHWQISQAFAGSPERMLEYPEDLMAQTHWNVLRAEPTGRVNLAVPEGIPEEQDLGVKLARTRVYSDAERDVQFDFGFSDRISVFINGRLIFIGDNTYRSRSERYLGVMTLDNDSLFIPLRKGENELLVAVTEAFGGWGLTGRLADSDGLRVRAHED